MISRTLKGSSGCPWRWRAFASAPVFAAEPSACIITKTDTNPFFVKMREGAKAASEKLGIKLTALAGREDGDTMRAVAAIGILHRRRRVGHPARSLRQCRDRRHRQDGPRCRHPVIALDTRSTRSPRPTRPSPPTISAGELIGVGPGPARRQGQGRQDRLSRPLAGAADGGRAARPGFMQGFGIDLKDPKKIGDESDPRIVCHDVTSGNNEGGRKRWRIAPPEGIARHQRRLTRSTSPPPPVPTRRWAVGKGRTC